MLRASMLPKIENGSDAAPKKGTAAPPPSSATIPIVAPRFFRSTFAFLVQPLPPFFLLYAVCGVVLLAQVPSVFSPLRAA